MIGFIFFDRLCSLQQANGAVLQIVIVARVCTVIIIGPVNFVILQFIDKVFVLRSFLKKITGELGPCLKNFSSFVECSEETTLFSPDQIFLFIVHTVAVYCVKMRNRYHNHRIVVLHVGEPLCELIVLDLVTKSRRRLCHFVV